MLNHISIGSRDIERARTFYDAVMKPLGYKRLADAQDGIGYGKDAGAFWVSLVKRPVKADPDNGLHICFDAPTRASVDAFYKAALAAGGADNGKPGVRENYGPRYYAAFVVDPDGYRIEAYCGKP